LTSQGGHGVLRRVVQPDLLDVCLDDGRHVWLSPSQADWLGLRDDGHQALRVPERGGRPPCERRDSRRRVGRGRLPASG